MRDGLFVRYLCFLGLALLTNACKNHPPGQRAEAGTGHEAAVDLDALATTDQRQVNHSDVAVVDGPTEAAGVDLGRDATVPTLRLSDVVVYADCMLTYPQNADPIIAVWTVSIEGAGDQRSAMLKDATLTIVSSRSDALTSLTQHLKADVTSVALSGGAGSIQQTKTGTASSANSACMNLCDNATWSLDLTFDLGTAHASGPFSCPM
jgi:hypothetical protein